MINLISMVVGAVDNALVCICIFYGACVLKYFRMLVFCSSSREDLAWFCFSFITRQHLYLIFNSSFIELVVLD